MPREETSRLRILRKLSGLTLRSLHERTGISSGRLSMIERGLAKPSPIERAQLASAYGFPERELFGDAPEENSTHS